MTTITRTGPRESERLRRAAAAADQGPADEQRESLLTGRSSALFGGGLLNDQDPTNVSFPFLRRIRRDHGVSMGVHYIKTPLVKASWYVEADQARVAAFVDNLIRPIFASTVLIALRMIEFGYSPAVRNYDVVSPSWTFLEDGQTKKVWDNGSIGVLVNRPLVPLRPEVCRPHYSGRQGRGRFDGIQWDEFYAGPGHFMIDGRSRPSIDLMHSFWASHDSESEDGSPFGFARIAYCAPIFHMYRYVWTLLARAFENSADPGPTVGFPKDEGPVPDGEMSNLEQALMVGRRKRSGSTIAIPSDIYEDFQSRQTNQPKWYIRYDSPETNFVAIQEFLGYLEAMKFRALWMSEQSLSEGAGGSSSRNVAASMSSQRDTSQVVLMEQVIATIMEQLVKPAMAINMPWYEGKVEMKTIGFGQDDEDTVRQVIQLAGQADLSNFGIDLRRLAESRGLPVLGDREFAQELRKREEAAVKQAEQEKAPAVEPTQGRRALVTQTGFGEMVYQQVHDPVELSDDGDFVASLPPSDPWRVREVVDAARAIRSRTSSFLSQARRDAALDASERASELERGVELADGDVDLAAGRLLSEWVPRRDEVLALAESTRVALERAYDGAIKAHLRRLRHPVSMTKARSDDARGWLDERSTRLVQDVVRAVRDDMAMAVVDATRAGQSTRSIANQAPEDLSGRQDALASALSMSLASAAYRHATVDAGLMAGVQKAQTVDGGEMSCGQILDLADVSLEDGLIRLLPSAPDDLSVVRTKLGQDYLARYDADEHVVLIDSSTPKQKEAEYLLALGETWAAAA